MYNKKRFKKATKIETVEEALARGIKIQSIESLTDISSSVISEFYESLEWIKKSQEIRRHSTKCERCGNTSFLQCDHIKPLKYFWHLRLDDDNLQTH